MTMNGVLNFGKCCKYDYMYVMYIPTLGLKIAVFRGEKRVWEH